MNRDEHTYFTMTEAEFQQHMKDAGDRSLFWSLYAAAITVVSIALAINLW